MSMEWKPSSPQQSASTGETILASSKEAVVIKKLQAKLEEQKLRLATMSEAEVSTMLASMRMLPGVTVDTVLAAMLKAKMIIPPPVAKPVLPTVKVTNQVALSGITSVDDPQARSLAEARLKEEAERKEKRRNKILEEEAHADTLEKDIFQSARDLDLVYVKALSLDNESEREKPENYYAFAEAGLIKGGREEVEKDLAELSLRQKQFTEKTRILIRNTPRVWQRMQRLPRS